MLASLIANRSRVKSKDDSWQNYTDIEIDNAFSELMTIQNNILKLDFRDPRAKLFALSILLDDLDQPNFADDFKNKLFDLLRRFELSR